MRLGIACLFLLLAVPWPAPAHADLLLQIEEATRRIEREPKNGELYLRRGELHRAHQDWDAAQADYDRARSLDAQLAVVDLARGKMYLEAGWPLSALVALDRFVAGHTNHADALVTRARALAKLSRYGEAARDYNQAIEHAARPQPEVFLERSQALIAAGDAHLEEALRGLEEGMRKLGPLVTLQLFAIDVELKQKRVDAALARLDRVASQSPRKETWLARRGEILQQAGRAKEAIEAYQAALRAIAALPPARRQVPAMAELEKRVRQSLESTTALSRGNQTNAGPANLPE
jgi:tetratricopeptide (TPR) repeat protein